MENTSFGKFNASPHPQNHPVIVGRFLGSGELAAIFAGLELAGLLNLVRFAGESPGGTACLMSVLGHRMEAASDGIHPQNLLLICHRR